ncbi:DIAP3 protein, partial [Polypterus senegalus]
MLSQLKVSHSTSCDWSTVSPEFEDFNSRQMSEKEILALFEKMMVACMQLINALVTSPDDLDFRLHIRNEFMRCGLKEILPHLNTIKNEALDIQLKVFEEHKEEDMIEFSHRLEDIKSELEYPF